VPGGLAKLPGVFNPLAAVDFASSCPIGHFGIALPAP
jgi:hypothetical protein